MLNNPRWWIYYKITRIKDHAMYHRWFKKAVALIHELKTEYGPNSLPVIPGTSIQRHNR